MSRLSINRIGKEAVAAAAALLITTIIVQLVLMVLGLPMFEILKEFWMIVLIIVIAFPLYLGFRKGV